MGNYNILNPRGYLHFLYSVFFDNWNNFPKPKEGRHQLALILQSIILITLFNFLAALIIQRGREVFDWQQVAFGVTVGFSGGLTFGVMAGLKDSVVSGVTSGAAFGVALAGGLAGGLILVGGVNSFIGKPLNWTMGLLVGLAAAIVSLIIVFILSSIDKIIKVIWKPRHHWIDWGGSIILLLSLSLTFGYVLALLAQWLPVNVLHPLLVAVILFLVYSHLPLWPLEALWGGVVCLIGLKPRQHTRATTSDLAQAIRRVYFDRLTIFPLPGETATLRRLAQLDEDFAIREAIKTAIDSNHLLPAVEALQRFATVNPLLVQAHLNQVFNNDWQKCLLRYTTYNLPETPARIWQASERLNELARSLLVKKNGGEKESDPSDLMRCVARLVSSPDSNAEATPTIPQTLDDLQAILQEFEDVQQKYPNLRYVATHLDLYSGLLAALRFERVEAIGGYNPPKLPPLSDAALLYPPDLHEALSQLNDIAARLRSYVAATSPVTRRLHLLHTDEILGKISPQIDNLPVSVGPLLVLLIAHWQRLIVRTRETLAQSQLAAPYPQPYVIANPVVGPGFVGREDVMWQLESLWAIQDQRPSVVLYGHRRMGKTSILQNLHGEQFGPYTLIVDFNLQTYGLAPSTGALLHNLALALYDKWQGSKLRTGILAEPAETDFTEHDPYNAFNRFLRRLDKVRGLNRLIVTLDEFETIENRIQKRKIEPEFIDYLRGVITTWPWLTLALAGLHTLREMTKDYWHPLYGTVQAIPVSFLSADATRRLLTAPSPNFPVDYTEDTVNRIYALTHGQPYLAQLIGHNLVTRLNQQIFEQQVKREALFSLDDLEAAIDSPEFYRAGNAYFAGVWAQAGQGAPGQQVLLKALTQTDRPASAEELATRTSLNLPEIFEALRTLKRHDVIHTPRQMLTDSTSYPLPGRADKFVDDDSRNLPSLSLTKCESGERSNESSIPEKDLWDFTVELMRRWVRQHESGT
jgi:hypothetical protein